MCSSTKLLRLGQIAALVVACLLLSACGKTKLTKANFNQVKLGMSLDDVQALLGKGDKQVGDGSGVALQVGIDVGSAKTAGSADLYVWESGARKIKLYFRNDKLVKKDDEGL